MDMTFSLRFSVDSFIGYVQNWSVEVIEELVTNLQLSLEEELLRTLWAIIDLVFLPVHGEDMLLQLIGLDEHWRMRKGKKRIRWSSKNFQSLSQGTEVMSDDDWVGGQEQIIEDNTTDSYH